MSTEQLTKPVSQTKNLYVRCWPNVVHLLVGVLRQVSGERRETTRRKSTKTTKRTANKHGVQKNTGTCDCGVVTCGANTQCMKSTSTCSINDKFTVSGTAPACDENGLETCICEQSVCTIDTKLACDHKCPAVAPTNHVHLHWMYVMREGSVVEAVALASFAKETT